MQPRLKVVDNSMQASEQEGKGVDVDARKVVAYSTYVRRRIGGCGGVKDDVDY